MPLYCYHCDSCGQTFEVQHKMAEPSPVKGPGCDRADCCMEKQLVPVAAIFKMANPFINKKGPPISDNAFSRPKAKSEESTHVCSTGCAMHTR